MVHSAPLARHHNKKSNWPHNMSRGGVHIPWRNQSGCTTSCLLGFVILGWNKSYYPAPVFSGSPY